VFLGWFFTVGQAFAFAPLFVERVPAQWFILGSTLFGLLLPAVVITRVVDGGEGVAALARRVVLIRAPWHLYLIGVVVMPLLAMGFAVAFVGMPDGPPGVAVASLLLALIVNFFLNNLWEEVAWTGFVQARLQVEHGAMRAALIAAPLFALQHVALLVGNGLAALTVILLVFALVMVPYRAFNAWLYNRTGGSLFLVGLVHALSNAVGPGSGFTEGSLRVLYPADAELVGVLHIAALALMGLVVMAATRLRLGEGDVPA
jgi:membrane protease YdiL (CAAX protease family)